MLLQVANDKNEFYDLSIPHSSRIRKNLICVFSCNDSYSRRKENQRGIQYFDK